MLLPMPMPSWKAPNSDLLSPLHFSYSACIIRRDAGAPFKLKTHVGDNCTGRVIGAVIASPMLLLDYSMEMCVPYASSNLDVEPDTYHPLRVCC